MGPAATMVPFSMTYPRSATRRQNRRFWSASRTATLVCDLTASDFGGYLEVLAIHAEGSLEAQKLAVLMDVDLEPYKRYARRLAGIEPDSAAPPP